jgi:hypothetical protein
MAIFNSDPVLNLEDWKLYPIMKLISKITVLRDE